MSAARPLTFVVPLPPSYRGGTEEYAYRLVAAFSRTGPVRALTTTARWDASAELLPTGSASVERLRATELFERPVLWMPGARGTLRRDVRASGLVNLHMPFPLVEAPVVRLARRCGIPTVLTYHMDADLGAARSGSSASIVTRAYRRWSAHPALEGAEAVVANSRGYAEASPVLREHLSKVRVIPKGVDPVRLRIPAAAARVAPPTSPDRHAPPTVLFVGRLVPYKGLPVLIDAVLELARASVPTRLRIAGRGPERDPLEARVKAAGLGSHVEFLGFVPDEELGDLYRRADVVVVPSLGSMESSATTLEEAAACGTPVIGSRLPGASESIPDDGARGILVPPGDSHALAEAIRRLLAQPRPPPPERLRTWDDVTHDYRELFRALGVDLPASGNGDPAGSAPAR